MSRTIPIVMIGASSEFLIRAGLIKSLARPGGTVTGLTESAGPDVADKRLQLLKEVAPKVSRVAHLFSPPYRVTTEAAARALGVAQLPVEVTDPEGLDKAFSFVRAARVGGLFVGSSPFFWIHRQKIIEFAASERLPATYWYCGFADSGGLMSYGVDWIDLFRRTAGYVDRILKGASSADLPMEQPNKFELVINLQTAKALGLTIPRSLLLRVDGIIE